MDHDVDRREGLFNALYDAHYPAVRAYAWRRDPAFVDDIVAETFLVAWKRLEDVPPGTALPWLLAVARNAHLNIQRSERRRRERESTDAAAWLREESDSLRDVHDETGNPLLQLLRRLPEPDREVLLLVAWEGLDRAAIAQVIGCSRANVALRLHRARRRFQALLDEDPTVLPAGVQAPPPNNPSSRLLAQGVRHD